MNFIKTIKNIRWEIRYKNLEKKYTLLKEEYNELKKQFDKDFINAKLRNNQKYIKLLKRQRDDLRNELNGRRSNIHTNQTKNTKLSKDKK